MLCVVTTRARYLTEGSRGSIKDSSGLGHPVVKLFGYNGSPVKLQCFIGHDKHIGVPHLFYQASKITGKNSSRCSATKIDGTAVISMDLTPENGMQTTIDCIGILKVLPMVIFFDVAVLVFQYWAL